MKLLLLIAAALVLVAFSTSDENKWSIHFHPWTDQSRIVELERENAELKEIAGKVEERQSLEFDLQSLTSQKAAAQSNLGAIQASVLQAKQELTRLLNSAKSVKVVISQVTPIMGTVGCRSFSGNSMNPTFTSKDLVCISNDTEYLKTVRAGDIVIVPCKPYWGDTFLIHRIVSEINGLWQTQGDNNGLPDQCLNEKSSVTYKVTGIAKDVFR